MHWSRTYYACVHVRAGAAEAREPGVRDRHEHEGGRGQRGVRPHLEDSHFKAAEKKAEKKKEGDEFFKAEAEDKPKVHHPFVFWKMSISAFFHMLFSCRSFNFPPSCTSCMAPSVHP